MFKRLFLNGNVWIVIKISLNFVCKGSINNIPELVQIMVWRRPGDKPLSEPIMVSLLMHICVTRPQWVNSRPEKNDTYFADILTHWPLGDLNVIFKLIFSGWQLGNFLRNCPQMNVTGPYWWQVNIGSGNGLVASGNKPLLELMLTQIYVTRLQWVDWTLLKHMFFNFV